MASKWTIEEEKYLKQNYLKVSIHELERVLQKSQRAIYSKAHQLARPRRHVVKEVVLPREEKQFTKLERAEKYRVVVSRGLKVIVTIMASNKDNVEKWKERYEGYDIKVEAV